MNVGRLQTSVLQFAVVSATGLLLDIITYHTLILMAGLRPFFANVISALLAITFVFSLAGRYLFLQSKGSARSYFIWVTYQCGSIAGFSVLIELSVDHGMDVTFAKIVTLPFSFVTNYIVLRTILASASKRALEGDKF